MNKVKSKRNFTQRKRWTALWFCVSLMQAIPTAHCSEPITFSDVTADTSIDFVHYSGGTGKHFLVETVTSGIVTLDYDNDGLLDIYFLSGSPLLSAKQEPAPQNRLYRNLGGFRFQDMTQAAGVGDLGFALGAATGDYDNDGDADIFIANFGPTVLLENQNDGTFVRHEFPHGTHPRVGAGIALLDVDADGNLDIYVSNYVEFSFEKDVSRTIYGVPAAPGPKDYQPDSDVLYRNSGNGEFEDVSKPSGIGAHRGPGMGVVAFDYDEDGDSDIYVCNDSASNFLFENDGQGSFEEVALYAGAAYDVTGGRQASMGVDVADWNHDGRLDLVTTNFVDEIPTLYENTDSGYFDDIGAAVGLGVADRNVTWGVGFGDFDNDSWPDLFIASGHLIAGVTQVNDSMKFEAPNAVLRNLAGTKFEDQTSLSPAVQLEQVSRGIAIDDFDQDSLLDVAVLNLNSTPQILKNTSKANGKPLIVRLVGTRCNRDAVGSKVTVKLDDGTELISQVIAGRGYQSSFGKELHFGLGQRSVIEVKVRWIGGREQSSELLQGATTLTIIQD